MVSYRGGLVCPAVALSYVFCGSATRSDVNLPTSHQPLRDAVQVACSETAYVVFAHIEQYAVHGEKRVACAVGCAALRKSWQPV